MATLAVEVDDDAESCIVVGGRATARAKNKNSTPSKVSAGFLVSDNLDAWFTLPCGTNRPIDHSLLLASSQPNRPELI
jgi:hypothetical protein